MVNVDAFDGLLGGKTVCWKTQRNTYRRQLNNTFRMNEIAMETVCIQFRVKIGMRDERKSEKERQEKITPPYDDIRSMTDD